MQLYLDSFGAFLHVKNGQFAVRTKSAGELLFPLRDVAAILMTRGTSASTDALLFALKNDVPVLFIDENTHFPVGQVWSGEFGSISTIRKNQAAWARSLAGFQWVAGFLARKIDHQRDLLRRLGELEPASDFEKTRQLSDRLLASLSKEFAAWPGEKSGFSDKTAGEFRGKEGTASRLYWQLLVRLVPPHWGFDGRGKRPATDPFNALLNYLYGMLYTQTQLALMKAGLDPSMAVLHADQFGSRPTLVFDFIEPFRGWADEVALDLVRTEKLTIGGFDPGDETTGWRLAASGKDAVVHSFLAFLAERVLFSGRQIRRGAQLENETEQLAQLLKQRI